MKQFKFENIINILIIITFIYSLYCVGISTMLGILFNITILLVLVANLFLGKYIRKFLYEVFYENK